MEDITLDYDKLTEENQLEFVSCVDRGSLPIRFLLRELLETLVRRQFFPALKYVMKNVHIHPAMYELLPIAIETDNLNIFQHLIYKEFRLNPKDRIQIIKRKATNIAKWINLMGDDIIDELIAQDNVIHDTKFNLEDYLFMEEAGIEITTENYFYLFSYELDVSDDLERSDDRDKLLSYIMSKFELEKLLSYDSDVEEYIKRKSNKIVYDRIKELGIDKTDE